MITNISLKSQITYFLEKEIAWKIITIVIVVAIFIQSSRPSIIDSPSFYQLQFDKGLHILAWLGLSFSLRLGSNSFVLAHEDNIKKKLLLLIFLASFYGLLDEIHQSFVPSRVMDLSDVLADSIGSVFGTIIAHFAKIKKDIND